MKIQNINNQNFGKESSFANSKNYADCFYSMDSDDKLDVIYGMLLEQKQDLVTLSKNQAKIQKCNDNASMFILNNLRNAGEYYDTVQLGRAFDGARINIIA